MITYKTINLADLTISLFNSFQRTQIVTKCWRKVNGQWVVRDIAFVDDWSEDQYRFLIQCLQNTIVTGGLVAGAFSDDDLKGFVSVEAGIFGDDHRYMDLSSLHVSQDIRRAGIGRELFKMAGEFAKANGAKKLYISAHSAVETQAFYRSMGCVEAQLYNQAHVENEPCDCQMECVLS